MTDIENRLAILEQEFDVLKNQIQMTLLEIQEQVLTNAYPELRSNGTQPAQRSHHQPEAPIQSVSLNQEPEPENKPNIIRMVNVNEPTRAPVSEPQPQPTKKKVTPVESKRHEETDSLADFEQYEEWIANKVEKFGVARTRKLVKVYAKQGHLSIPAAKRLLSFLSLYEEEVQKSAHSKNGKSSASSSSKREDRSLIVRLITGLSSSGERKHG